MTQDLGTLTVDNDHATMTFVRRLPHPVAAVWEALTDPTQRKEWFGITSIDPREGGNIEMLPSDPPAPPESKRMTGQILKWDPPHLLEHEWRQDIVEHGVVRYELREDGDHTVLTFTHRGLSLHNARGFIPGVHAYLDRLEAILAGSVPPQWQQRYSEVAGEYPSD